MIHADTIMTLDYPELNLILNCAGTSSAAAEDSAMSKQKKEERRHSAPLPVATAATAQAARSTANAVISSVLQRARVPQQEGEEKMDTQGGGTAPLNNDSTGNTPTTEIAGGSGTTGTAETAGGSGTAGTPTQWNSSRVSRESGSGTAGPVAKAAYRSYHQDTEGRESGPGQDGPLTSARYKNIQMQRKLRSEHTAIGSGPAADTFSCGDIFLNADNRNNNAVLVEDNRVLLVSTRLRTGCASAARIATSFSPGRERETDGREDDS
jgi:hypothetical protein